MDETRSNRTVESTAGPDRTEADRPPRITGLPLLGNTLSIARDPLGFVSRIRGTGDVVSYDAFGMRFTAVFDPAIVETVLVSRADEFRKGEFERSLGELVGPDGVAFTEGDRWRRQRHLLQSSFTPDRVQSYADVMVSEASAMIDGWDGGETIDLRRALSRYTLRVLTRALFDVPIDDERAAVVRRATEAISDIASPSQFALQSVLPSWLPTPAKRDYETAMAALEALVDELVANRRAGGASGEDLLSLLAAAEYPDGSRLTSDEVRDQLVTFLFAGHETTATALTFACWLLAASPAVRDELGRELEAVCGDRSPTVADLDALSYTEAAVREAMRLYPPVVGLYREPRTETMLGGYRIPQGRTLQLSVYGIHRDDRWWDEPGGFRPKRWLAAGEGGWTLAADSDRPEYAYFPFGGGPRHCLGMRFAMMELQLALATIVRRVGFDRVTETLEPEVKVTLEPGPLEVRVRK